jgi:hypothetical protein
VRITRGGLALRLVLRWSRGQPIQRQKSAEGIVRLLDPAQGPNMKHGARVSNLDDEREAESPHEMADAAREGSRRNRRDARVGASNVTARRCARRSMTEQLMQAVVERENINGTRFAA